MGPCWRTLAVLTFSLTVYSIFGAFIFSYVEAPYRYTILEMNRNSTDTIKARYSHLPADDLDNLIAEVVAATADGRLVANTSIPEWNMPQSLFFVSILISTIGYGNIVPRTPIGRMVCIIFALIGIPLNVTMLAAIGRKINILAKKFACCPEALAKRRCLLSVLHAIGVFVVGWVLLILLPAKCLSDLEGWTYGDSVYFTFTTLSTIGFGDLSPDLERLSRLDLERVLVTCWLWIGLAWLSTVITCVQEAIAHVVCSVQQGSSLVTQSGQDKGDNGIQTIA